MKMDSNFEVEPGDEIVLLVSRGDDLIVRYTPNVTTEDLAMMLYSVLAGLNLTEQIPENSLPH